MMNSLLCLLLLLLSIRPAFSTRHEPDSLRLRLIRNPPDPLMTRADRIRDLVRSDRSRHRFISASINRRRQPDCVGSKPEPPPAPAPESFAMPLSSGAYTGTGQYFVRVRVGTPAQPFLLVADTGSDLTWVNCKYGKIDTNRKSCGSMIKRQCGSGQGGKRVFDADRSRSFHPIRCSSELCVAQLPFSLTTCPVPTAPCAYDYGYSDGSTAQGFFANESVTIALSNGRKKKLKGLTVGCTSSFAGSSFRSSDGVLGLGHSNISFANKATTHFGGKFSYCLVDHLSPKNTSGYLTFGPNDWLNSSAARHTELMMKPTFEPFYAVGIVGISIAGEVLRIPGSVWSLEGGGGAILDSGTSLTILAEPAYGAVVSAFSRRLHGIPRVDVDPFSFCYNWTNVGAGFEVPKLVVHFNGSALLEPPAKSYLIDVEDGVKCLGFVSTPWPGTSTIGNIMQQEHIWEFDIRSRRVGFQRSTCKPY